MVHSKQNTDIYKYKNQKQEQECVQERMMTTVLTTNPTLLGMIYPSWRLSNVICFVNAYNTVNTRTHIHMHFVDMIYDDDYKHTHTHKQTNIKKSTEKQT